MKITVKKVPEHVRDELAAQAARKGQSMQAFLLAELTRLASEPWIDPVSGELRPGVQLSEHAQLPGLDVPETDDI